MLIEAVGQDVRHPTVGIDLSRPTLVKLLIGEVTTADTVDRPRVDELIVLIQCLIVHPIGVEALDSLRFPEDLGRSYRLKHLYDSDICHMPLTRSCQ